METQKISVRYTLRSGDARERQWAREQTAHTCWEQQILPYLSDGTPCIVQFGGWTEGPTEFMDRVEETVEARFYLRPAPDLQLVRRRAASESLPRALRDASEGEDTLC